jgi:hypothetical protein
MLSDEWGKEALVKANSKSEYQNPKKIQNQKFEIELPANGANGRQ